MGPRQIVWYAAKRIVALLVVLLLIASVDFVVFRAFSDDFLPKTSNPDLNELIISEYRLNHSKPDQYLWYMWNTITLDFGLSISYLRGGQVADFAYPALERSLWLFGIIGALALFSGVIYEAVASRIQTKTLRIAFRLIALGFLSLPAMGLTSIGMDLAIRLDLPFPFRAEPYVPEMHGEGIWNHVYHNLSGGFLPVLFCVLLTFGFISLFYKRQAATGAAPGGFLREVVRVVKDMMTDRWPVKFYFAWIVSCALVIDVYFDYFGLGSLFWRALMNRDLMVTMTAFLFIAATLAVANCIFDILAVLATRRNDSVSSPPEPEEGGSPVQASVGASPAPAISLMGIWTDFRRSKAGLAALVVFLAIIVAALAAPVLATVENPNSPESYEINEPPVWRNPLPPSFDPSPLTGFRHPLGTDHVGMDIYSAMVYGARTAVVSCLTLAVVSFLLALLAGLVGTAIAQNGGLLMRTVGWIANAVGDAFVAIPLTIILVGPMVDPGLDEWTVAPAVGIIIFLWASVVVAHRVGVRVKPLAARARGEHHPVSRFMPTILAETLRATKLSVTIGLLSVFAFQIFGFTFRSQVSWADLLVSAYEHNATFSGYWWWYLPPLVGISVLVMSSFTIIDTLERVVRKKEMAAEAPATQPPAFTAA